MADTVPAVWVIGGDSPIGVVFGTYDLLEKLGWGFTHPSFDPDDPETRPVTREIRLPSSKWAKASAIRHRTLNWFVSRAFLDESPRGVSRLRAKIDWAVKNRYNLFTHRAIELPVDHPMHVALREEASRRGLGLHSPGHSFGVFMPDSDEAFLEHPEWFGEIAGKRRRHGPGGAQFCWSDAGAGAHLIENASRFAAARSDLAVLTLGPLDGYRWAPSCTCSKCTGHSATDRYLRLANRVSEHLAMAHPGVITEALVAYQHVKELPTNTTPHSKLRGRFAVWARDPARGYSEGPHGAALRDWAELFEGRLTTYQYYSDHYAGPPLPCPYTRQIQSDRAAILEAGADGILNLVYLDGFWWRQTLNAHLAGRAFFDADADPLDLLGEYALRYHGPAAGPHMSRYLRALAETPELGSRIWGGGRKSDVDLMEKLRVELLEPAVEAAHAHPVFRHRMAKATEWHRVAEAMLRARVGLVFAKFHARSGRPVVAARWLSEARQRADTAMDLSEHLAARGHGVIAPNHAARFKLVFERNYSPTARIVAEARPGKARRRRAQDPARPG